MQSAAFHHSAGAGGIQGDSKSGAVFSFSCTAAVAAVDKATTVKPLIAVAFLSAVKSFAGFSLQRFSVNAVEPLKQQHQHQHQEAAAPVEWREKPWRPQRDTQL